MGVLSFRVVWSRPLQGRSRKMSLDGTLTAIEYTSAFIIAALGYGIVSRSWRRILRLVFFLVKFSIAYGTSLAVVVYAKRVALKNAS